MTIARKRVYLEGIIREAQSETNSLARQFAETQTMGTEEQKRLMGELRRLSENIDRAQHELRQTIADDLQGDTRGAEK